MTYLDYNATCPVDPRVIALMGDVYKNHPGNAGSRTHVQGDGCREIVETARKQVASLAGVEPVEVIFTSGATESDNIAILGLSEYGRRTGRTHVVTTKIEHKAVLGPAGMLESAGFEVDYVPVNESGVIDAADVVSRVRPDTLLVSVMHVNNETGAVQPVLETGERIRAEHPDTFFHVDASQSFGKLVDEVRAIKCDLLSATAHKMGGPQGVGVLVARRRDFAFPPVRPLTFGGGQERGLSPGTQPVALIAGFGLAAELCEREWSVDREIDLDIKEAVLDLAESSGVEYLLNADQGRCLPTTLNISFPGVSSEALMIASRAFASVSNGSACSSNSYKPSYVLTAMGLGEQRASEALRLSWGRGSNRAEVEEAFARILSAVKNLQG